MAQTGQYPAFDHLNGDLRLGLVFRLVRACREDGGAVMMRLSGTNSCGTPLKNAKAR